MKQAPYWPHSTKLVRQGDLALGVFAPLFIKLHGVIYRKMDVRTSNMKYHYALIDVFTAKCKVFIQLFFDAASSDTIMYIAKCYGGMSTYLFHVAELFFRI